MSHLRYLRSLFAAAFLLAATAPALAQPLPPGTPINRLAPQVQPVLPLGMQRGTTLEITLTGANLADPTGVWTSFPAKVTIPTDAKNGKDNTRLRVKLEVAKDAPLGFHTIRLATHRGMSNARLFCIDDLPQVLENNTNRSLKSAQAVKTPCVVVGKADAEVTDYFKFTVKANQRLSFEVLGRRLGSAFDPEITLYDASGRELPRGHSNDAPGLQTDARLTYTFKTAGDYVLGIRDTTYRGGPDFYYRLRIGDFPCATTPLPLAAKRGTKVSVRFAGPTVDGVAAVEVAVPNDPLVQAIQVAPRGKNGLYGWPVSLAVSDLDEALETEPNNEPAKANRIKVPGAITARFETAEDVDHFVFSAKKGQRFIIEAHTTEHNSPTDVDLVLQDAKGKQLQASNPAATPRLDFTAPLDGDYTLVAKQQYGWGGPDEVYRITITPFQATFSLTIPIDRMDVASGGTLSLPIMLARAGYNGAIEVSVVGPKGLSGTVTIPAGPPRPPNLPAAMLPISAAALPAGPLVFRIQGKATIDKKPVVKLASVRAVLSRDMANLLVPPRETYHVLAIAVREKPPFSLALKFDAASAMPGKPITATVTLTRNPGFLAEVVLSALGLPPGMALVPAKVLAKQTTAKIQFNLAPGTRLGSYPITLQGQARHGDRDHTGSAPPVALVVKK
jgi:hypothetical protein